MCDIHHAARDAAACAPPLQEAAAALSMNNLNLMGSLIKVELAASAYRASPQVRCSLVL